MSRDTEAHILLVEDDDTARMLLADVLVGAGYEVTTAPDGETALSLLQQRGFNVIISDIRMHDVDGIEVLSAAKVHEWHPTVILLTGYGSLETAVAALRAGAFDYILKPAAPDTLLACVARAVERNKGELRQTHAIRIIAQGLAQLQNTTPLTHLPAPDEAMPPDNDQDLSIAPRYVEIGALVIDHFRHTVLFNGQNLHLTPIEYALLSCLAESRGRVVNYCEIVRRTHGHDVDEAAAQMLLKAHIRNMRRKIDSTYLVNVRGTGYMLIDPEQ